MSKIKEAIELAKKLPICAEYQYKVEELIALLQAEEPKCKTCDGKGTLFAPTKWTGGMCVTIPCPDCQAEEPEASEKRFPLLGNQVNIGSIPWWVAEQAYMIYANKYGDQQSLERLAERGGFGIEEMDEFYPEWRTKCSIIDSQAAELKKLKGEYNTFANRVVDMSLAITGWREKLSYNSESELIDELERMVNETMESQK